jgi:AcrR family transcriptional regulator
MTSARAKKKRIPAESENPAAAAGGLRARHSDDRRKRLVKAARALLTEADGGSFSMPALAERAGLSLATPYNLFGSKAAILHAVFEAEVVSLHGTVRESRVHDPIQRLMAASDHLSAVFDARPGFYRGLARELSALGADETQRLVLPLAETVIKPLLGFLGDQGALPAFIPVNLVNHQLQRVLEILVLHWMTLGWSGARLRAELRFALSTTLVGYLNEEMRPRLNAILKSAAKELAPHYRAL